MAILILRYVSPLVAKRFTLVRLSHFSQSILVHKASAPAQRVLKQLYLTFPCDFFKQGPQVCHCGYKVLPSTFRVTLGLYKNMCPCTSVSWKPI